MVGGLHARPEGSQGGRLPNAPTRPRNDRHWTAAESLVRKTTVSGGRAACAAGASRGTGRGEAAQRLEADQGAHAAARCRMSWRRLEEAGERRRWTPLEAEKCEWWAGCRCVARATQCAASAVDAEAPLPGGEARCDERSNAMLEAGNGGELAMLGLGEGKSCELANWLELRCALGSARVEEEGYASRIE